jgi:hypothetical protein
MKKIYFISSQPADLLSIVGDLYRELAESNIQSHLILINENGKYDPCEIEKDGFFYDAKDRIYATLAEHFPEIDEKLTPCDIIDVSINENDENSYEAAKKTIISGTNKIIPSDENSFIMISTILGDNDLERLFNNKTTLSMDVCDLYNQNKVMFVDYDMCYPFMSKKFKEVYAKTRGVTHLNMSFYFPISKAVEYDADLPYIGKCVNYRLQLAHDLMRVEDKVARIKSSIKK